MKDRVSVGVGGLVGQVGGVFKSLEIIYKDNALPPDDKKKLISEKGMGPVHTYKLDKAAHCISITNRKADQQPLR